MNLVLRWDAEPPMYLIPSTESSLELLIISQRHVLFETQQPTDMAIDLLRAGKTRGGTRNDVRDCAVELAHARDAHEHHEAHHRDEHGEGRYQLGFDREAHLGVPRLRIAKGEEV